MLASMQAHSMPVVQAPALLPTAARAVGAEDCAWHLQEHGRCETFRLSRTQQAVEVGAGHSRVRAVVAKGLLLAG
jgi:hypothetical protein